MICLSCGAQFVVRVACLQNMEKLLINVALALCVLLMTAAVSVKADEDESDSQETGWF